MKRASKKNSKEKRRRRASLRKRDGDNCWLCGEPMEFDSPTHRAERGDRFATIDHVVERSKGGANALSNLRLAHQICNKERSEKWIPQSR